MDENNSIQLFEDRKIRTAWDEEKEEWYFSVVDVIAVLTDQPTARSARTAPKPLGPHRSAQRRRNARSKAHGLRTGDRKSTRLNSSHNVASRMPSSA